MALVTNVHVPPKSRSRRSQRGATRMLAGAALMMAGSFAFIRALVSEGRPSILRIGLLTMALGFSTFVGGFLAGLKQGRKGSAPAP